MPFSVNLKSKLQFCQTRRGLTIPTDLRYASEVDVDFVRKSIKAIGQTAIKIDVAAERCVNVLLELINTRVSYVVQEAVVVMKVWLGLDNVFAE